MVTTYKIRAHYDASQTLMAAYVMNITLSANYDPGPVVLRGNFVNPVNANLRVYRGDNSVYNLTMDGGSAGGPYTSWVVVVEITSTVTNTATGVTTTTLLLTQTLTHQDDINGVFQMALSSSTTTSTALPLGTYDIRFWRTDSPAGNALLAFGKLILLQLELQ